MTSQTEIARVAGAIVEGKSRLIEGARRIAFLSHQLDFPPDQDILYFIGLDSEAGDHPLGKERQLWNPVALSKLDKEVYELEKRCMDDAVLACKRLIARYGS